MAGGSRPMKAATKATILHKVMKKKAISSIGLRAKLFAPQGKLSMQIKIRALQQQFKGKASQSQSNSSIVSLRKKEQAKASALRLKVKKAAMKAKETEKLNMKKEKQRRQAEMAAAIAKEEALLSPEALQQKKKLESLVGKDFKQVIEKVVQDNEEDFERHAKEQAEPMDASEVLSEQQLSELNRAVDVAVQIYKEMWIDFIFEYDRTNGDGDEREDRAAAYMETVVTERYEECRAAMTALLPFVPPLQPNAGVGDYSIFEVSGYPVPERLKKGAVNWRLLAAQYPTTGEPALEKVMGASLACLRRDAKFRALEAFSALMAVISARKEKSFLEVFETRKELESEMKRLQKKGLKVQSKTSAQRKDEIRKWLEKQYYMGYGYFAHYLVKPHATMRVAFKLGVPAPMPVSVIATEYLTLFDALGGPDTGDGSFIGPAKSFTWCSQEGSEFAFQEANLGIPEKIADAKKLRVAIENLQPDPAIRELLLSGKKIVYLEVTAALAPRDVAKRDGLSAIVIAELAKLMADAKDRGEAVLFCLGSDSPHKLAEKVYLRKPIGDHGLRCGYFRWRKSADVEWAREALWEDRPCHCLQMP